jgi:hypothetical protein
VILPDSKPQVKRIASHRVTAALPKGLSQATDIRWFPAHTMGMQKIGNGLDARLILAHKARTFH